jgi:hypothetical protein
MATVSSRSIDITDVARETITHVDLDKKTYSVITFAEMRQALAAMAARAGSQNQQADLQFDVEVKDTGERRNIQSLDTHLMKMLLKTNIKDKQSGQTASMSMENDLWLAPTVPGYEEVRAFNRRFAEKLGMNLQLSGMMRMFGSQPGMSEGTAKFMREAAKLDGVPVLTITRMKGAGVPGAETAQAPNVQRPSNTSNTNVGDAVEREAANSARNETSSQVSRATGGRFGGLTGSAVGGMMGGFGRRKKQQQQEEQPAAQQPQEQPKPAAAADPGVFMETTTELTSFSAGPVDSSKFQAPAGFKEVEHEMKKALREK